MGFLIDTCIWIQAIQHGLGLVTRNESDFAGIPGLDLVNMAVRA